jgi:ABC-type polysaccharide/polyol phosphate transport system ATPase subunit
MPSDDIAVSVRNLTKTYRLFAHPGDRVKQFFSLGLKRYHREFTALKDVSFDIKKGETVGIIGRNGSGKSTLLQLTCGILKPTAGTVKVNGRVSALLELGAGFNPEFTGRENVFFHGALLGFTKAQMEQRFDEIAAFADIGEFIDQPVRTYSSGMFLRLAFAVAISMEPDILVVDEALSVGDSKFQIKCAAWLRQQRREGTTVLLVSHDMNLITSLCDRVLVIDGGRAVAQGEPSAMTAAYHRLLFGGGAAAPAQQAAAGTPTRYGSGEARLVEWGLHDGHGRECRTFESGAPFRLCMKIHFLAEVHDTSYGFAVKNRRGTVLWGLTSISQGRPAHHGRAGEVYEIGVDGSMWLAGGDYFITLGAAHLDHGGKIDFIEEAIEFRVLGPAGLTTESVVNLRSTFFIEAAGVLAPPQKETGTT